MTSFEILLLLMLVAIALLQVARRLSLPYPAMLAGAGVILALIPGTPVIAIDPATYLALFIAPVLVDAAYDFPPGATRRFLAPLVTFAVFAVILTTLAVAWLAHALIGLPIAAGIALGAIVSPPDAAAASAVLRGVSIPKNMQAVLQGESLFNDSTALLLFSGALAVLATQEVHVGMALRLGGAVPVGILFGILCAYFTMFVGRFVVGTLGGNLLQFILAYAVWILASHLGLSAVLATVAFAMTLARKSGASGTTARMRVQTYAVWSVVVFGLNVFAFMLMGMQARSILVRMDRTHLRLAIGFAALVVLAIIVVRMLVVMSFHEIYTEWQKAHGRPKPGTRRQAIFVGWCGMRGFVTMATALALPQNFPQRDAVVLTAFVVVVATLVLQGASLSLMTRKLKLNSEDEAQREVIFARRALAHAAVSSLQNEVGPEAENLRYRFRLLEGTCEDGRGRRPLQRLRELGLRTVHAQRASLEELREKNQIDVETYLGMQEQTDWFELTMLEEDDLRIEET